MALSPRQKNKRPLNRLVLGKYVLDSLSAGMYSHPFMSLREYIQNSTDAIDCLPDNSDKASIEITIDGRRKSLTIRDTGAGISTTNARGTLLNIGCSQKNPTFNRGFRGIGRLGGLGYCDELVFITKSQGETKASTCAWDCNKLKQMIADPFRSVDVESLVKDISIFKQTKYPGSKGDHFFTVEMNGIHNGKNELLNVPAIKSYLSQVAPVPFHPDFSFGQKIENEVSARVKSYHNYSILVNGERIYKPYRDVVTLSKGSGESLKTVNFIELQGESGILGFAWLGELSLQGTVSAATDMDGLRLRYGNMMIGSKETLSQFFREHRFNNYLVGEIHVCSSGLLPNSRRDDFEESGQKDDFQSAFIRDIGIPLSRKIRYLSSERSKTKQSKAFDGLFQNAARVIERGYLSELQKEHLVKNLDAIDGQVSAEEKKLATELLRDVMKSRHILSSLNNKHQTAHDVTSLLTRMLAIVYAETSSRPEAERLFARLYRAVSDQVEGTNT